MFSSKTDDASTKTKEPFYVRRQREIAFSMLLFMFFTASALITFQVLKKGDDHTPGTGWWAKAPFTAVYGKYEDDAMWMNSTMEADFTSSSDEFPENNNTLSFPIAFGKHKKIVTDQERCPHLYVNFFVKGKTLGTDEYYIYSSLTEHCDSNVRVPIEGWDYESRDYEFYSRIYVSNSIVSETNEMQRFEIPTPVFSLDKPPCLRVWATKGGAEFSVRVNSDDSLYYIMQCEEKEKGTHDWRGGHP